MFALKVVDGLSAGIEIPLKQGATTSVGRAADAEAGAGFQARQCEDCISAIRRIPRIGERHGVCSLALASSGQITAARVLNHG